jgi:hypothetical protein
MTAEHQADEVTIEVVDPTLGPSQEAERLPLAYIEYDPKDDVVVVAVGGRTAQYPVLLRHMTYHPTKVDVAEDKPAVRIVEPDGTTTPVTLWTTT